MSTMQITVNGESREVARKLSLASLLEQLDLSPQRLAVEVNLQLIPRTKHPEHYLQPDDQLEIVTLAGGG